MKLFTNVKGIKNVGKGIMIIPTKFDVRIKRDNLGTSLSITNKDTMFLIPITKSMLRELMKDVN